MPVHLEGHDDGVILPVSAQAGGRKSAVRGCQDGILKVSVTQVAEKGKANQAIIRVLAEALGLRRSQIELIAGETSSKKRFLIRGATLLEMQARLAAALDD